MKSKGRFLVVTDMREAVGVEEIVGRPVLVNEDHIVQIEAVEPHIAEVVGYNATIITSKGWINVKETQLEILDKLFG